MPTQVDAKIIIIGGGLGGLTLAAILHRLSISCIVLERTPILTPVGAGISLAPNALAVLDQLGLYPEICRVGQKLKKIQVHYNTSKWRDLDFTGLEERFGYPVMSVERAAFHRLLWQAAGGEGTVRFGCKVVDIVDDASEDVVRVKLDGGHTLTCNVAVGADGIRSVTRRILARNAGLEGKNSIKFTGRVHFSGYTAPLKHLGNEELGVANWMFYDNAILTTWPCKDNRQWFIGVKKADPEQFKDVDRSVWAGLTRDEVNQAYGSRYHPFAESGKFSDIVNKAERVIASNVFSETDFPSMSFGRIALLGDAAHSMTSFFGQGACQAIEDATVLANALTPLFASEKPPLASATDAALAWYCGQREPRARDLVTFSEQYATLHTANMPWGLGPVVRKVFYGWVPVWCMMSLLEWLYGHQPRVEAL